MALRHKFGAKPCESDNIKFPSLLEKNYYHKLKRLQKEGKILFFLRQVPFHLEGNVKYVIDFVEFWAPKEGEEAGEIIFTEVKGHMTDMARLKIAQATERYGIEINIVKKV